jgi:predicted small lipoprotein YifL
MKVDGRRWLLGAVALVFAASLAACGGGGPAGAPPTSNNGNTSGGGSNSGGGSTAQATTFTDAQIIGMLNKEQATNSYSCGADAIAFTFSSDPTNWDKVQPCWHFLAEMTQNLTAIPNSGGQFNASFSYVVPPPTVPTNNCGPFPGITTGWQPEGYTYTWAPQETISTYCRNPQGGQGPPSDLSVNPSAYQQTGPNTWVCLPQSSPRLFIVAVAVTNSDPNAAAAIVVQGPATRANCQLTFPTRNDPFGPSSLRNYHFYLAWETLGQPEPSP